jgi:5-formyltetrahydrofolate cyclo-ligase
MHILQHPGRQIFETLKAFKPYRDAQQISIYLAMPSGEVQTDAIVRHALASGKQVFIPYLHKAAIPVPDTPRRVMDMVRLQNLQDYESLARDSWGIPSIDEAAVETRQRILDDPSAARGASAEPHTLDLMLMPGVAFDVDEAGLIRRLGHGKGFYDYFINRYIERQQLMKGEDDPVMLYGLALTEQLLSGSDPEQIPIGPFDRTLHGLVVGNGDVKESVSRLPNS